MVGCIKLREHLLWHTRIMGFVVVRVYNLKKKIFGMVRDGVNAFCSHKRT